MSDTIERIKPDNTGKKITAVVIAIIAVWILSMSIVVTNEDEYTLIREFGKVDRVISEPGLTFKVPFVETATTYPKKVLLYDLAASDVITMDKKTMVADCYVLWRITDPLLFVQSLNGQITAAEGRINATVYNALKNVISSLDQTEVIRSRDGNIETGVSADSTEEVRIVSLNEEIMQHIDDSMDNYGIEIITVETKQIDLPSDNKAAVYERMISERNNIAAAYIAEGEAEATKIRTETDNDIKISISEAEAQAEKIIADAEAEYMKILSEAYADESRSEFYTYVRSLDALKLTMQGDNKTVILSSDSPIAQIFNNIE